MTRPFNLNTTEGYTADEIDMMNRVFLRVMDDCASGLGYDDEQYAEAEAKLAPNVCDRITNAFFEGVAEDTLFSFARIK